MRFGDLGIVGASTAGIESWFRVSPPGVAFDAGRGVAELSGVRRVFLSHGHLDHSLGVPFQLSQRNFAEDGPPTRIFCPAEIAGDLEEFVQAAERLERVTYRYEIVGLGAGDRVELGRGFAVESFATDHVVPSLGFDLLRTRKRLASRYVGLPPDEIASLKRQGVEVEQRFEVRSLSYCGDTGPAVLDQRQQLFEAEVLLLECTFLGDQSIDKGPLYKHVHVADLIERQDRFQNAHVVLLHLSRRHQASELREILERKAPRLAERVVVFPAEAAEEPNAR